MRLLTTFPSANEELIRLVNQGYRVLRKVEVKYDELKKAQQYDDTKVGEIFASIVDPWAEEVIASLKKIFPTELEINKFTNPEIPFGAVSGDYNYQSLRRRILYHVRGLEDLRENGLRYYTDLPVGLRLFVEDIESFMKVRDVNPATVANFLVQGFLDQSEDSIQMALEQILDVPMHKKDWGGETNDLYTANVIVNGKRTETAFLLKGNGLRKKVMEISDCGANGDQLVRLMDSPARLFVVQFVGNISENLIRDTQGKVEQLRAQGKDAAYCIIDGQDTARVLHAYGKL